MRKALLALWLAFMWASGAWAANCAGNPYTLVNGTLADATQVMANFNNLLSCANNILVSGASPIFTGTATFPDGSTWNSTGPTLVGTTSLPGGGKILTSSGWLGIGVSPSYPIDVTYDQNGQSIWHFLNNSSGTSVVEAKANFDNGTYSTDFGTTGTNGTGYGLVFGANQGIVHTDASGGLTIASTGGGRICFSSSSSDTTCWMNLLGNSHALELGYTSNQTGAPLEVNGNFYAAGTIVGTGNSSFNGGAISLDSSFASGGGNGTVQISYTSTLGGLIGGEGSICDFSILEETGALAACVPHATSGIVLGGSGNSTPSGQLANSATSGFVGLPTTTSGVPSGTPGFINGWSNCIIDNTDSKLECYFGSQWNHITFTGGS